MVYAKKVFIQMDNVYFTLENKQSWVEKLFE